MAKFDYDILVIGGGYAGRTAAQRAAGFGKKVGLIEKNKFGDGCAQSRALIHAASLIQKKEKIFNSDNVSGNKRDDVRVLEFVKNTVHQIDQKYISQQFIKLGINVFVGSPHFIDRHHIMFDGKKLSAKNFIIATGSSPFIPAFFDFQDDAYLTTKTFFSLSNFPSSLLILGGGQTGIEFASALNRIGVSVTVVEMNKRILPNEDHEFVSLLQKQLIKNGIILKMETQALNAQKKGMVTELTCMRAPEFPGEDNSNVTFVLRSDALLLATGTMPAVDGLALENAGVTFDDNGIKVDSHLRTTAGNIYACGDVIGGYQFAHIARYQAALAAQNACTSVFKQKVNYDNLLWVTYTDPEFASFGLTEQQAREKVGSSIRVYRTNYADIDRGIIDNATGLGKVICDKRGKILGAHLLGNRAGELIHELQVVKYMNQPFSKLACILHAYPSYAELIWEMAKKAEADEV